MSTIFTIFATELLAAQLRNRRYLATPTVDIVAVWDDQCASRSETTYAVIDPDRYAFEVFANRWESETAHLSSSTRKTSHPAFEAMSSIGPAAIPWALKRLRDNSASWRLLLERLVMHPPHIVADGDMRKLKNQWLRWGRIHGYRAS